MKSMIRIGVLLFLASSCKSNNDAEVKGSLDLIQPVELEATDFQLKAFSQPGTREESYMPQKVELYLYPSTSTDSIYLGTDIGGKMIEEEVAIDLQMPAGGLFYIRSYYAGGANLYYGLAEGDQLIIYKGYEQEPQQGIELSSTSFERVKTVRIYPNLIRE